MQSGAKQLRDWMDRRGFNQSETADFLGFPESMVSMLLSETRTPGLANAIIIERKTGIAVEAWTSSGHDESGAAVRSESPKAKIHKA